MQPQYNRWDPRRVQYYHLASPQVPNEILASYTQATEFLKAQFLIFDDAAFSKFCTLYENKNGQKSRSLIEDQYLGWKQGQTKIPTKIIKRILECVPPCLSKEEQFKLLGFQIPSVLNQQKNALKIDGIYTSELKSTYRAMADIIKAYDFTLEWFLNDLFSSTEIEEFTNIFIFTMLDRLRQSFEQVHQDLTLLLDLLPTADCSVDFKYQISLLGCTVKVDTEPEPWTSDIFTLPPEPLLVSVYKPQYQHILLEYGFEQRQDKLSGKIHQRTALHDIEQVIDQLKQISYRREYETTLYLSGSGGMINLRLQKKKLKNLYLHLALQILKLTLIAVVLAASALLLVERSPQTPLVIVLFFIVAYMILPTWIKIQKIKTEIAEYGQKQRKRITTVRP